MNQVNKAVTATETADDAVPDPSDGPPEVDVGVGVEVVLGSKIVEGRRVVVVVVTVGVDTGGM